MIHIPTMIFIGVIFVSWLVGFISAGLLIRWDHHEETQSRKRLELLCNQLKRELHNAKAERLRGITAKPYETKTLYPPEDFES
jgi:hypothetical protein